MNRTHRLLLCFLAAIALPARAQSAARPTPQPPQATQPPQAARTNQAPHQPERIVSPEVHPDRSVTFRFRDPNAKEVVVALEGAGKPLPMQKDEQGVWKVTTEPLEPDYYGYSFVADSVSLVDPSNASLKPNLLFLSNQVHVPGPLRCPGSSTR